MSNPSAPIAGPEAFLNLTGPASNATNATQPTATPVAAWGSNPLGAADQLFIVQVTLVIVLCKSLSWLLAKIKQPSVIAEVISGILLGPTVMGRIPGFTTKIFPTSSLNIFIVFADIGLIFFMNLIGLELNFDLMAADWKRTAIISVATMAVPFVISIGSSWAVWESIDQAYPSEHPKSFGTYLLFMGVAMSVTAFPVLARIVKEKQLFRTRIGVTVLSTAAWADVAAWTLLALSISLISGGGKLNILWTFLCLAAYAVLMFWPMRLLLRKLLIRNGEPVNLTPGLLAALILATLANAWLTAYFGLHSIFGAFVFGIILPREKNFNVKIAEKYEDFVTAFFLPLYFTASGLQTQLGLLDSGNTWGLLLLLVSLSILTKIGSGCFAAKLTGMGWRESFTLGVLMNTKGLVELIVLNIGLQNKLISPTTFSMMVVLAIFNTFITSPIVHFVYPYHRVIEFENQTQGKTVLMAALKDRQAVAPMLAVFSLITCGRSKKYRLRIVRTMALPDRPSAYMVSAHADEILEHVLDLSRLLTLKVKTVPLTYDDTEVQKIQQLVTSAQANNANFFFAAWKLPISADGRERLPTDSTVGGPTVKKIFTSKRFHSNMAVLVDRGLHSTVRQAVFIYTGSEHDVQAAKLAKGILYTPNAHLHIIYAMNARTHPKKAEAYDEIKDAIIISFFRRVRPASTSLDVVHGDNLTTAIINAVNMLEDPGLVICGTPLDWENNSDEGVRYAEVVLNCPLSFLCITKGSHLPREAPEKHDENHFELHALNGSDTDENAQLRRNDTADSLDSTGHMDQHIDSHAEIPPHPVIGTPDPFASPRRAGSLISMPAMSTLRASGIISSVPGTPILGHKHSISKIGSSTHIGRPPAPEFESDSSELPHQSRSTTPETTPSDQASSSNVVEIIDGKSSSSTITGESGGSDDKV